MEFEVSGDNEQQLWTDIQEVVSAPCSSEDLIDNALRAYLSLATKHTEHYLQSELEVTRCSFALHSSTIFAAHTDYVRRQMIYGLLQEDDPATVHMIASFLLFDGRQCEALLHMMNEEGVFPRLLELLHTQTRNREDTAAGSHRLLMDLLYEMSRIQRIRIEDLILVDDDFIRGLFDLIEELSYDANDPYHYPVIRVLLVLNEQFMISAHNPDGQESPSPLTNRIIKVLSMHGNLYKTFGENIILLINREDETSLQLLILKLLYLIFTTPSTYEYFFTNDLHVLVDILIRSLLDLPEEASALRHTYLRVLYPLLAHTQLRLPPHYKPLQIKRMLSLLVRGGLSGDEDADCEKIMHFDDVDETTRRLVLRCASVDWIQDQSSNVGQVLNNDNVMASSISTADNTPQSEADIGTSLESSQTFSSTSTRDSSPETLSSTTLDGLDSPASPTETPRKLSQVQRLGMHLDPASSSSLSVNEVASQREKPGIMTPSRHDVHPPSDAQTSPSKPKVKPLPPKTRRWRGRQTAGDEENTTPITAEKITEEPTTSSPIIRRESPSPLASVPTVTTSNLPQETDRRNSTNTSGLVPPAPPAQPRRSASHPPPAVPPPRRSTIHNNLSAHCTPVTSPSRSPAHAQAQAQAQGHKQAQKPEPPRTRRWGRGRHAQTDSDKAQGSHHNSISSVGTTTGSEGTSSASTEREKTDGCTISVEEAVQNVSLQ